MACPVRSGAAVWCVSGPGIPFGARVTRYAGSGRWWLDVCIVGQHLPQMYRTEEIRPLIPRFAVLAGLCPACLGFGTTANLAGFYPFGIDEIDPCEHCGGTGRPCLRAAGRRSPDGAQGDVQVLPHKLVTASGLPGVLAGVCLGCGNEAANHAAHPDAA